LDRDSERRFRVFALILAGFGDLHSCFGRLECNRLLARGVQDPGDVLDGFTLSLSPLPPFDVIGAFGMDLDLTLNPDLVLQGAVRFHDGGKEVPLSIYAYFFENVDSVGRAVAAVLFHHALLSPEIGSRSNPGDFRHHTRHQGV
jgi:hypothetical protein